MTDNIYFKDIPTDKWLNNLIVKATSTKGLILIGNYMKDKKIIVKLSLKEYNDEYKILSLIDKIKTRLVNVPIIYGNMSCYEKIQNIKEEYERIKGKGICYGNKNDKDSTKIYLSIVSYIENAKTLQELGNNIFPDEQFISLVMQGLFTIYQLYYVFGIMHKDYNTANIMIQQTKKNKLDYKFACYPYRFFPHELGGSDDIFRDACHQHIETYGIRLYLIDFDQASVYHSKYKNTIIKHTCIEEVDKYMTTMLSYGDQKWFKKYQLMKESNILQGHFHRLHNMCLKYQDKYNQEPTDYNNYFMLDRTSVALKVYIDFIRKMFGLNCEYRIV